MGLASVDQVFHVLKTVVVKPAAVVVVDEHQVAQAVEVLRNHNQLIVRRKVRRENLTEDLI